MALMLRETAHHETSAAADSMANDTSNALVPFNERTAGGANTQSLLPSKNLGSSMMDGMAKTAAAAAASNERQIEIDELKMNP